MTRAEAIKVLQSKIHLDCSVNMAIKELEAREVAITALREQEQREQGCEFCLNGEHLNATFHDKYGLHPPIAFCPLCGKKLMDFSECIITPKEE